MSEQISLPVLFVPDLVVLPGMVVPIPLDDAAAQAAVDAGRASDAGKLLIAPRLDDRYPTHGVVASIVQVGRVPGQSAYVAVLRGEQRAHIGSGTTGPGAALWVEVDLVEADDAHLGRLRDADRQAGRGDEHLTLPHDGQRLTVRAVPLQQCRRGTLRTADDGGEQRVA